MPDKKTLSYYTAELRRIEESRQADTEKEVKKIYKELLKDLNGFLGNEYAAYSNDEGVLSVAILQEKARYAKFLQEVDQHLNSITPKVSKTIRCTVEDTYKAVYTGVIGAVQKSVDNEELKEKLKGLSLKPEVMKNAVENPISGLTLPDTLEKHRKEVIYNIKQQINIGLMTGERCDTMAKNVKKAISGDDGRGGSYGKAMNIVRTEVHRVQESGMMDCAEDISPSLEGSGLIYTATWRNMGDANVRPSYRVHTSKGWKTVIRKTKANHQKMEGQVIKVGDKFDLGTGVFAKCPGSSGTPENDCRCRCFVEYELMTVEEFAKATGKTVEEVKKQFGVVDKPKKEYLTKKKLQENISNADAELESLHNEFEFASGGFTYKEIKEKYPKGLSDFAVGKKLDTLNGIQSKIENVEVQKADWQAKLDKKLIAEKKKTLTKEQIKLQEQLDNFDIKTYSGIWKNDVTTADWANLNIEGKKKYYEGKFTTETDPDKMKEFQDLYNQVKELDIEGKAYHDIKSQLAKVEKDLTNLKNGGIINKTNDAFSQERKDAALWFTDKNGGFSAADDYFDPVAKEIFKNATKKEFNGFYTYTSGSGGHNRPLAGFEKPWNGKYGSSGWEEGYYKGPKNVWIDFEGKGEQIRGLTTLIQKSTYDKDVWVQSGQGFGTLEGFLNIPYGTLSKLSNDQLQQYVGEEKIIHQFISAAVNKGGGSMFNDKPMKLNIYVPKGSQLLYASDVGAFGKNENEIILQRGGTYKITKIYWGNDETDENIRKLFVDMELHPEEGYDLFQQDPNEWKGSKKTYKD